MFLFVVPVISNYFATISKNPNRAAVFGRGTTILSMSVTH